MCPLKSYKTIKLLFLTELTEKKEIYKERKDVRFDIYNLCRRGLLNINSLTFTIGIVDVMNSILFINK